MGNSSQGTTNTTSLPQLQWGGAKVRLECAFLGKTHRIELDQPFARIGSDPRCEFCIPGLPAPVCVYLQVSKSYVAVIELVESVPASVCEPVFALPGATVWIQPNARITVESIEPSGPQIPEPESFSWENFNVEDVRVFPNTLVARSGFFAPENSAPQLRLLTAISVLGTASSCHLRANHKHISNYQAIIFRGEQQGESCRVVDLFGQYPTLVEEAPANGQILEIGGKLRISNITFEAVRFLYNASRPSQIVEVRSQFTSLPLPNESKGPSSERQASSMASNIHSVKDRLVRAIGFDTGNTTKAGIHIPLGDRKEDPPKESSSTTQKTETDLIARLQRVAVSQERMAEEFEKLTSRLDGVEKSLVSIPEILEQNSQQLIETIDSLREILEKSVQTSRLAGSMKENAPVDVSLPASLPNQTSSPHGKSLTKTQPPNDQKARSTSTRSTAIPKPEKKNSSPSASRVQASDPKGKEPKVPASVAREDEFRSQEGSWFQRTTAKLSGWLPNNTGRRREIAQRDNSKDPLNLGSQSTATRKRLQQHEDESELLAASQSEDESLVLGSLMGLRYRDARKTFFRWMMFGIALTAISFFVGPLAWQNIPEGWRELIWQKITFAKPEPEREYQPSPPKVSPDVPSAIPTEEQEAVKEPDTPSQEAQRVEPVENPESENSTNPEVSDQPIP